MRRTILIWSILLALLFAPILAAAFSPLLQWRQPVYIVAGFAGIVGMALMVMQPLAAAGYLPGLSLLQRKYLHRAIGAVIVFAVFLHVLGLWFTSPPDVVDALLFRSPTPFSIWGVLAMWAIFASGVLAIYRFRGRLRWRMWRRIHLPLAALAVSGTIIHVSLIEGTMEMFTKTLLCAVLGGASVAALFRRSR